MATRGPLPDDGRPLHQRIREWVLREIEAYPLEARLPSDRELARRLGASLLTVNKVMVGLAREGYVVRKRGKGTFLASGERRVLAAGKAAGRRGEVLFAYPDYFSYGYWSRLRAAEELALKRGMRILEFKMRQDTSYEDLLDLAGNASDVRGIILVPAPAAPAESVLAGLGSLGVPVVVCSPLWGAKAGTNIYNVSPDVYGEGYLKVRHLAERGHRRIGHVRNEPDSPEREEIRRGMLQALADLGLERGALRATTPETRPWQDSTEAAWRMTKSFLRHHRVTALILDSQAGAAGAMRALWDMGLRVPEDVSLIATGDSRDRGEYMTPPLTSVVGDEAAEMAAAFQIISGVSRPAGNATFVEVRLVERSSVADLRAASSGHSRCPDRAAAPARRPPP